MGLMSKLKNILFEEEEVEIPVIEKKVKKESLQEVKIETPQKNDDENGYRQISNNPINPISREVLNNYGENVEYSPIDKERMSFSSDEGSRRNNVGLNSRENKELDSANLEKRTEKSFDFPSFDEEEFISSMPKRSTNIIDFERKKELEREALKKAELTKIEPKKEEKTKFKPSPIISPVYGILDKNYTPDKITSKTTNMKRTLDVDSVRKKAFGIKEKEDLALKAKVQEDEKILEEKISKARTIDDLLNESSDAIISLDELLQDKTLPIKTRNKEEYQEIKLDTGIKKENIDEEKIKENKDDNIENDLFDLIDSMYENSEEGE